MGRGSWITIQARAVVLAVAIFALVTPARSQSCDVGKVITAIGNAAATASSPECDAAYSESAFAVAVLAGVLAALDQNTSDQICGDVSNIQQWSSYTTVLQGLPGFVAIDVASCACEAEQGFVALGQDVLGCIQVGLCGLQQALLHEPCGCTPPPPQPAKNCSPPSWCANSAANANKNECKGAIIGAGGNPPPVLEQQTPGGTRVLSVVDGWDGSSPSCTADEYCFCPSPMTLQKWQNGWSSNGSWYYSCQCPKGTSPSPKNPNVCICDGSNIVATPPDSAGVICHVLTGITCKPGQESVNGQCVTPCANPKQIQLANGTCCDPAQASACGECCPSGQAPDPVSGNCKPALQQHPGPVRPLPGPIR
jgi:hypothetical protein